MTTSIQVSESDIDLIKEGQDVTLSFDAFTSLEQTGTVTQVAPTGSTSGSLVKFEVQITLISPDERLRPGMSASVAIVTGSAENVLVVPNAAITEDETGKTTVQVVREGDVNNPRTVEIETGLANDMYTEVKSGLSQGEVVVTGTLTGANQADDMMQMFGAGGGQRRVPSGGGSGGAPSGNSQGTSGQSGSAGPQAEGRN
jgi:multidrug efflux pump subunit AcrA (membrane-fusion protein)